MKIRQSKFGAHEEPRRAQFFRELQGLGQMLLGCALLTKLRVGGCETDPRHRGTGRVIAIVGGLGGFRVQLDGFIKLARPATDKGEP